MGNKCAFFLFHLIFRVFFPFACAFLCGILFILNFWANPCTRYTRFGFVYTTNVRNSFFPRCFICLFYEKKNVFRFLVSFSLIYGVQRKVLFIICIFFTSLSLSLPFSRVKGKLFRCKNCSFVCYCYFGCRNLFIFVECS